MSVGAMVASINSSFTRFVPSANLLDGPAQELSSTMKPGVSIFFAFYPILTVTGIQYYVTGAFIIYNQISLLL